jgi:hypothetical protein
MLHAKIKRDSEKCIEFAKVESSNIAAVGVHGCDLIVWFKGGVAYNYPNSSEHFRAILAAESKGRYFYQKIKPILNYSKLCDVPGCLNKISSSNSVKCLDHFTV